MTSQTEPLELAHYYPGWIWGPGEVAQMKSLLLYFDGFALLLPDEHFRATVDKEGELAAPLHDAGLLHNLEPGAWLDGDTAAAIRRVAGHVAGLHQRLGQMPKPLVASHFHATGSSLEHVLRQMSRSGAVVRRRPDLGLDMVDMPSPVSEAVLLMVGISARRLVQDHRIHLVGDLGGRDSWRSLLERDRQAWVQASTVGQLVHQDITDVGVDLSAVPLDEVLDFRSQHGKSYQKYARGLQKFVITLESVDPVQQQRLIRDRAVEIADAAADLRSIRRTWGKQVTSLALAGAGAAWTLHQADPTGAILNTLIAIAGFTPPERQTNAFTYLFQARRLH